jgi:putative thioredoxin
MIPDPALNQPKESERKMAISQYVFDATADNFQNLVVENSRKGLVLVNFWSPKAGPCMVLMPRLVRLAAEYGGKFLLVMLNTDEIGMLVRRIGVTSVPTVKFFRNGEVVHTIYGAESETTFREALDRFISSHLSQRYRQGLAAWEEGNIESALSLLAQAAMDEADNPFIPRDLAKLLWSTGMQEEALNLLRTLPDNIRSHPDNQRLYSHFLMANSAATAPDIDDLLAALDADPDDHATRFQLAARRLADDQIEPALQALMEILRREPEWRAGQARQAMLHLLEWLGPANELAERYRNDLSRENLL